MRPSGGQIHGLTNATEYKVVLVVEQVTAGADFKRKSDIRSPFVNKCSNYFVELGKYGTK